MIFTYIKLALRIMARQSVSSFIKLTGLALGIACCLVLFLYVQHELSFDRFHEKADHIYRVHQVSEKDGVMDGYAGSPAPLGPMLVQDFPGIVEMVRIGHNGFKLVSEGRYFWETVFYADSEIFEIFTIPLIKGEAETAFKDPYSILISEEISRKYFGDEDPIGRIIQFDRWRDFKITGVFQEFPSNSHLHFQFLGAFPDFVRRNLESWGVSNYYTYILVSEQFSPLEFQEKMPAFVDRYRGRESRLAFKLAYRLTPITRIHLHSRLRGELEPGTDISTLYIFSAVALFILLIACFNYINLATAGYTVRAQEVGLRKVIGAERSQLIKQFLGESALFTFLALPLTLVLMGLILPLFNRMAGKSLSLNFVANGPLLLFLAGIFLFVALASGTYPAFFISAFQPVKILKGRFRADLSVSFFRKTLVVSQFVISIVFIICTLVIASQLHYMRHKKLGFNRDQVVILPIHEPEMLRRYETIKNELLRSPDVLSITASSYSPENGPWRQNYWKEGIPENSYPMIQWISVDHDFLKTLEIELLEGRDFSRSFPRDVKGAYLINQAAAKELGWDSPVGKEFKLAEKGRIVGVVKDFHFRSLHQDIDPLVLYIYPEGFAYFYVRIRGQNIAASLQSLKQAWDQVAVRQPFEYTFMDEEYDRLYRSEIRLGKIFGYVSMLAIFIACLGLFGLASFAVERRTKEIGIRKVLGSSFPSLIWLLSQEFTAAVLIANVIAWPLAFLAMSNWLQNFAYRTPIKAWIFFLAAGLALGIAFLTLSFRLVRAARTDPIASLRYE